MQNRNNEIRNLAFRRAAYQSSSYSVNETAQLVTTEHEWADETKMAYEFLHKNGNQSRYGNVKYLFDRNLTTEFQTYTTSTWVQVRLPRRTILGSYSITAGTCCGDSSPFPSDWILKGSMDGVEFVDIDRQKEQKFTEHEEKLYKMEVLQTAYTHYRLHINQVQSGDRIHIAAWSLKDQENCEILASYNENLLAYVSAWMSAGNKEEWLYVDLGTESIFDRVVIHWGSMFATRYEIQVSNDTNTWITVAEDTSGSGSAKELVFDTQNARYVRLLLKETSPQNIGYIVKEFEVFGRNSLEYRRPERAVKKEEQKQYLTENNWKVERAHQQAQGILLASKEYNDSGWLPAVVPGTVFLSYLRAGAVADPAYADWQRCASDSYFKSDFWYRTSFTVSEKQRGKKIWLNFDAVNWKAKIYLNGVYVGDINGGFIRGIFEISPIINWGKENYMAVLIIKNTDPGTAYTSNDDGPGTMGGVFGNDGRIGEDAPTYSAANGWDWVPTVRGRNIGIYNDVFLSFTNAVQVADPWAVTKFDRNKDQTLDFTRLNVTLKTEVINTSAQEITAAIHGVIRGHEDQALEKEITLEGFETRSLDIGTIVIQNPKVWWPHGYGQQPLYDAYVMVQQEALLSDQKEFKFGAREFSYTWHENGETDPNGYQNGSNLAILCNGVRILIRGGNWGLEDIHLDVDAEKYDEKIRLHKYENFNIIRNWGGQVNDVELYRACDKYGILIWDDFFFPGCWLHSPKDPKMFLENVADKIKKYRSHACLALYCGANEMYPEVEIIEKGIRKYVVTLDGTRHYIPNSANPPVAVDGPHAARLPEFYFENTFPDLMNSERGMPNIPAAETMRLIFPPSKLWPPNEMWALHDFAQRWNVDGAGYLKKLEDYGKFNTFEEMIKRAQMQSYELHKAMFEGAICSRSHGLMMWMSNPAWPSLVWQSYDYYHDVNGGYFGIKTACQPINLIWNRADNQIMLFHGTPDKQVLTCILEIYDLSGKQIEEKRITLEAEPDSLTYVFSVDFTAYPSDLVFIKTKVLDCNNRAAGENFYWHNHKKNRDFKALSELPVVELFLKRLEKPEIGQDESGKKAYQVYLKNESMSPALQIRIKVVDKESNKRILPVFYEDNYFSLIPGEEKSVRIEWKEKKSYSDKVQIGIEGFNVKEKMI